MTDNHESDPPPGGRGARPDRSRDQATAPAELNPPAPPPVAVAAPSRRPELTARLATAAAGIPIVLAVIIAGGPLFTVVVAVLLAIAAGEVVHAAGLHPTDPLGWCAMAVAATLAGAAHLAPEARPAVLALLVVGSLVIAVAGARVTDGFHAWSATVAAALYAGLLGSYLVLLRRLPDGRDWLLLMVFTTFAADTGAYATGRLLGRHKLAPHISPAKTVEGALGGAVGAAAAAAAIGALLGLGQSAAALLGLGAAVAVAAVVGDLAESLLKRSLAVKDMGRLFPGHGGVLDRLDSILFAAPVVYYLARWLA